MEKNKSTYYDPEKQRSPWLRIVFLILGFILIFVIILLITKGCSNKNNMETDMVAASEKYYKDNDSLIPKSIGECETVTLEKLQQNNKISNSSFKKCNIQSTLVKTCKLSSDNFQYIPILDCDDKKTEFDNWNVGKEDDLKKNSSDVSFKFLGEIQKNGEKNYYPDNLTDASKVSQYYISIPQEEYKYKDSSDIAYKWYVEKNKKEYYKDGAYLEKQPEDYTESEGKKSNPYITLTKPSGKSTSITAYAIEKTSYPFRYDCTDGSNNHVRSDTYCPNRSDSYKTILHMYYTCNGSDEVDVDTICEKRGNWSEKSCKSNLQTKTGTTSDGYSYSRQISTGYTCVTANGYLVNQELYKWFKTSKVNSYYPDDKESADEENTYYVNVPIAGAMKDENTKTTAYKYYKILEDSNSTNTIWVGISDDFSTEEELIAKFKELGYDVNSLEDIENNPGIRYQIELSYRNRK